MSVLTLPACTNDPRDPDLPRNSGEAAKLLLWEDEELSKLYDGGSPTIRFDVLVNALMGHAVSCSVEVTEQFKDRYAAHSVVQLPPKNDGEPSYDDINKIVAMQVVRRRMRREMEDVPCDLIERIIDNPWF
jgi:hypothetical protein